MIVSGAIGGSIRFERKLNQEFCKCKTVNEIVQIMLQTCVKKVVHLDDFVIPFPPVD